MKMFKYIFLLFLSVGYLASCSNDFLLETNPNELATDNYWRDLKDTEKGITAIYAALRNEYVSGIAEDACRSDMAWPGYGRPTPTSKGAAQTFYFQQYTNSLDEVQTRWDGCYRGIFYCNQVIEALDKIKTTSDSTTWVNQMATARFFRGLFHFYLHSDYNNGNVIIQNSTPKSNADLNKNVSPSADVIRFFRADLRYAYQHLPAKYPVANENLGKVTAGTAATILGTSYLYENQIDSATTVFKDVVENPAYGYALETDMKKIFTTAGEFNKESILEIAYNNTIHTELSVWDVLSQSNRLANNTVGSNGAYVPAWLIYAYKSEILDTLDSRNFYTKASAPTVKIKRNVSLRTSAMVAIVEDTISTYYLTGNVAQNGKFVGLWGLGMYKKYSNYDIVESETKLPKGNNSSGKNICLNRLADVYLMYAECLIKANKVDEALVYINKIRNRWALQLLGPDKNDGHAYDKVNYTAQSLMERLMYVEKPLELSCEGHAIRWNDLRRWGITKQNFDRLASESYYLTDFTYKDIAGKTKKRTNFSVVKSKVLATDFLVDYEYDQTANNYNPKLHDYLPIPLSEILTNSGLK